MLRHTHDLLELNRVSQCQRESSSANKHQNTLEGELLENAHFIFNTTKNMTSEPSRCSRFQGGNPCHITQVYGNSGQTPPTLRCSEPRAGLARVWLRAALHQVRRQADLCLQAAQKPQLPPAGRLPSPPACASEHPELESLSAHPLALNLETRLQMLPHQSLHRPGPGTWRWLLAGVHLDGLGGKASWLHDTVAQGTAAEMCADARSCPQGGCGGTRSRFQKPYPPPDKWAYLAASLGEHSIRQPPNKAQSAETASRGGSSYAAPVG